MLFQNHLNDIPAFSHTYGETLVLTSGATPLCQIPEYLFFCIIIILIKIKKWLFNSQTCITSLTIFFYFVLMVCVLF